MRNELYVSGISSWDVFFIISFELGLVLRSVQPDCIATRKASKISFQRPRRLIGYRIFQVASWQAVLLVVVGYLGTWVLSWIVEPELGPPLILSGGRTEFPISTIKLHEIIAKDSHWWLFTDTQ
ncbi:hypothetical protein F4805DRAFT_411774 [Annulohypoxylon moriforme]|nr:hypothetical protein F4805DRAFT_411774 [Annulohypoxylon moriforme]